MKPLDPRVLPHLRPATGPLAVVVVGSTLGGVFTLAQAFAVTTVVVAVTEGTDWRPGAIALAAITVARALSGWLVDVAGARAAGRVGAHLRRQVLRAALDRGIEEHSRSRTGELGLLATRGVAAVEPYLTRYLPTLVLAAVLPGLAIVTIAILDWVSALIVVCTLPLIGVFGYLIGLATRDRADRQWAALSMLSGHFLDVVRGLPTLVAHRRAGVQSARIRAVSDRYRKATLETLKIAFVSSAALELIATISVALVAVTVGLRLAQGSMELSTALTVLLLAPEAYWPWRRVGAEFHAAAEGTATFEEISALTATVPPPVAGVRTGNGDLVLTGVSLGYGEGPVLTDFDAHFPARGLTAIVGASGAGKSTLLAALLGELEPQRGRIHLGELDLDRSGLAHWRTRVASVGQRPWLVPGTVADNVRVGKPGASDADVERALARVSLPLAADTAVGEDGQGLSAGQRARLALARVVIADRDWIVLDEPTAHLDAVTEAALLDTLVDLARDHAVIVVAHRNAVRDLADHVVALPAPAARPQPRSSAPVAGTRAPVDTAVQDRVPPPRLRRRMLGAVLATSASAFGVALTATAGWLIVRASEQPPVLFLMVAIVSVRLFGLGRPALRYGERLVTHDDALRLLAERRARVFDALVPLVPARLGRRRGDLLTSIVDDVDAFVDDQLRVRLPIRAWLGVSLLAIAVAGVLFGPAALVVAAGCLLGGALTWSTSRLGAVRAEPAAVAARALISARVVHVLASARQLMLWQADARALDSVDTAGRELLRATSTSARGLGTGRMIATLTGGLGLVGVAALVAGPVADGTLRAPVAALLLLLPLALVDVLSPLADAGALGVRTRAAQARVDALSERIPAVVDPPAPVPLTDSSPAVGLDAVTAGWESRPVLSDLSLRLPPGRRLGVVGPSGSGKSTLAALLLRFLSPGSGSHFVGEIDVRTLAADEVRRVTGLVDDDPYVFATTLAENLRLARPEADDAAILAALEAAHLGGWLAELPDGLDTRLGEGARGVSGGERARLGLARAVLADQPVLVLDEPTAHLDIATAVAVTEDLLAAAPGRTLVWITHTEVGLDAMDQVLRLGEEPAQSAAAAVAPAPPVPVA